MIRKEKWSPLVKAMRRSRLGNIDDYPELYYD